MKSKENITVAKWQSETPGRKYEIIHYGVLSRRIGGDGKWYGCANYTTLERAQKEMREALNLCRYQKVGGITVDFGLNKNELYERKLVKIVKHCEVIEVGVGPA